MSRHGKQDAIYALSKTSLHVTQLKTDFAHRKHVGLGVFVHRKGRDSTPCWRPPLLHRMSMTLYNVVVNMVVTWTSDISSTQVMTSRILTCKSRAVLFCWGRELASHMALQSHNQPSLGHVQMLMDYAAGFPSQVSLWSSPLLCYVSTSFT